MQCIVTNHLPECAVNIKHLLLECVVNIAGLACCCVGLERRNPAQMKHQGKGQLLPYIKLEGRKRKRTSRLRGAGIILHVSRRNHTSHYMPAPISQ